ncbi:aldehyde dehydrogenase [Agaricicola taiwanensis]|uniref:Aldehyde dehydrogenase n=1 Tax=Agaricicola taiwanensis TaxID=591372 RepID=A0A8J2VE40_9RHOB|nr:aldehyde dehydrogenase family protein [Agaricicola taiwanensis]GGE28288.1 aldehyde dehydrogenase [Agaricicola taiwanensis]
MTSSLSTVPCFIDGRDEQGSTWFDKIDPATGRVNGRVCEAGSELVERAVSAARRSLSGPWARTTLAERAAMLRRIADALEAHIDEIVDAEITDTGKPITATRNVEIPRAIANFRAFADIALAEEKADFYTPLAGGGRARNITVRAPIGVIGVVAPWNLPLLLLTWKVAPALVCGNAVVVKPSEHSPRTALLLARIATQAGLPEGVLNIVQGHGANAAGAHLTAHPGVDAITFTGETRTGEAIMKAASQGVRPVSLELGGKNAAVIFADSDIDAAAAGTVRSMFDNCGQVCLTTERILVQRPIYERFLESIVRHAETAIRPGDPRAQSTTLGPAISAEQRAKVLGFYDRALAAGASAVIGGGALQMPKPFNDGFWVQPSVFTGLPDDAEICRKEVFGPCAHVSPFDDEDEAVARVNASDYGLASALWSGDADRAERVARRIQSGTVWINCWRVRDERAAFGGFKKSGLGREGGEWSLDFYSELKTICRAENA